jgi:tetratricopeptide (TPR) repeat protein
MKKTITIIALLIATVSVAQSKYQNGMKKAFQLWNNGKMNEASQLFERIAKAEPTKWKPAYYFANIETISSFKIKDEATLNAKLKKAQEYLDLAKNNSENNPEIIAAQALINTAYIAFDGQKYGMTLSGKNTQLYAKALEIAPKNPRIVLANAEWNMGMARYFGKSSKPYCEQIQQAITLAKEEQITEEFYPKFQLKRAEQLLKQCEK